MTLYAYIQKLLSNRRCPILDVVTSVLMMYPQLPPHLHIITDLLLPRHKPILLLRRRLPIPHKPKRTPISRRIPLHKHILRMKPRMHRSLQISLHLPKVSLSTP